MIQLIIILLLIFFFYRIFLLNNKTQNKNKLTKNKLTKKRIIFILPNIYESINGVSNKYIKFIEYLSNNNYQCVILLSNIDNKLILNTNENIIIKNYYGITPPIVNKIKAPVISENILQHEIINGNEMIIFNGEFLWLYNILKNIKIKNNNIKIFPTWHTDYEFYMTNIYHNSIMKFLPIKLIIKYIILFTRKNIFSGIIVTGEHMKNQFNNMLLQYNLPNLIFNANEINLNNFKTYKIDKYDNNTYNIIYCGRIAHEKNIIEIFDNCNSLNNNINIHIIGNGAYKNKLINDVKNKYPNLFINTIFYGELKADEIYNLYLKLDNRIYIFTSLSETFGKTPMEAGICGIPCFIKESYISKYLYIDKVNALIFNDKQSFINLFNYFINLSQNKKEKLIINNINNIKQYDQQKIFNNWINFLENTIIKKIKLDFDSIIFVHYFIYIIILLIYY
jgi:hypothetical protein